MTSSIPPDERERLLAWYADTFAPDLSNYATMQPRGRRSKYIRANQPLTLDILRAALDGETTIAAGVIGPGGSALAAIIDKDDPDPEGVTRALTLIRSLNLWGVAFWSVDNRAHVSIPSAKPLPAPLLKALAEAIQTQAGITGECWPTGADLRLPLQVHRHVGRRFDILTSDGQIIDGSDGWRSLAELYDVWRPNDPELLTHLVGELAPPSPDQPAKLHKSKVNPLSGDSVISWFCSNYELADILGTAGAHIADRRSGVVRCPFHNDRQPSLGYWTIDKRDKRVCKCLSKHSNCPLAAGRHFDSFDLFCEIEHLDKSEAVKLLVERHGLGQRRTFKASPVKATTPASDQDQAAPVPTLESHASLIATKRAELSQELKEAANRPGWVTVVKGTPGIGKTEGTGPIVEVLHAAGRRVAIVAPSKEHAAVEWLPLLSEPFTWRARRDCCTCYHHDVIVELERKGYAIKCKSESCPYQTQRDERAGRVGIYQYPHLSLNAGELLAGYDLIVIDESPLASLLSEQPATTATAGDLNALARRMDPSDPGRALALALAEIATDRTEGGDLYGPALLAALAERVGDVATAIKAAKTSPAATLHPVAPSDIDDPARLPRQFWGRLLAALAHDTNGKGNALLSFGKSGDGYAWAWYEPAPMLARSVGRLPSHQPAIIVLDGTADKVVCERLYAPWPVHFVQIDAPLSPTVQLIQAPRGPSTRRALVDTGRLDSVARALAVISNELDLPAYDGLVSYQNAAPVLAATLGIAPARALWYGGQRGRNDLKTARTLAVVASPTIPPNVVERRARALWYDAAPIDPTWKKRGTGDYQAIDDRLEAVSRVHGPAELVQAVHRSRPLNAREPSTIVVLTPWNLAALGLAPSLTIAEMPYGNSDRARAALDAYSQRVTPQELPVGGASVGTLPPTTQLQSRIRNTADFYPQIVINQLPPNCQDITASPPLPANGLGKDYAPASSFGLCSDCGELPAVAVTPRGPLCADCKEFHDGQQAAPLPPTLSSVFIHVGDLQHAA